MAAKKRMTKEGLDSLRNWIGFAEMSTCTAKESRQFDEMKKNGQELPAGVFLDHDRDSEAGYSSYFRVRESELTEREREEFLALTQVKHLATIKNHLTFYTGLIVLYIVVRILIALAAGGGIAYMLS